MNTNGDKELKQSQGIEWLREIKDSLKKNIVGKCNWTSSSSTKATDSHDVSVSMHYPSRQEVRAYRQKPITITKGNPKLVPILNCTRLRRFAAETGERWMIMADHPGQDRLKCMNLTRSIGMGQVLNNVYDQYKNVIQRTSYLIRGKNALIDHSGAVMFECGYYKGTEIWELRWEYAENWENRCRKFLNIHHMPYERMIHHISDPRYVDLISNCSYKNIPTKHYDKVFVISASLDSNFHHLMADSLARLPRYLNFLHQNPDIKVHVRSWEDYEPMRRSDEENFAARRSRELLLQLLGIPKSRLISLSVTANIVYIPRAMTWADSLKNPTEVRLLARELLQASEAKILERRNNPEIRNAPPEYDLATLFPKKEIRPADPVYQVDQTNYDVVTLRKNLVILVRAGFQTASWGNRHWTLKQYRDLEEALKINFPEHNIVPHISDSIFHPSFCMYCEISEIHRADILLGLHGAGMTKQLFMPPGGVVFELTPHLNDAQMPLCGYYGNWAALFGHHHYLYAYDNDNGDGNREQMDPFDVVSELATFYKFIHSEASASLRTPASRSSDEKMEYM
jgi:hypothetical protein